MAEKRFKKNLLKSRFLRFTFDKTTNLLHLNIAKIESKLKVTTKLRGVRDSDE